MALREEKLEWLILAFMASGNGYGMMGWCLAMEA